MNTLTTLLEHRSIRKYKSDAIAQDIIDTILLAATRGANTGNMQLYSIIVTRDEEKKKKLWEYHFKQPMVLQAPLLLTFCADIHLFSQWCLQRKAVPGYDNFLWYTNACIDATIAAQNAVVAAEALGLGTCYLGTTTYMAEQIIDQLQLPKGVIPVTTLVIGYPDGMPPLTDRLPVEALVHMETYHQYTPEEIDSLFAEKEALPQTEKLIKENQVENLAQVFTEKRYKKTDNIHFSATFLETLRKQEFIRECLK